MYRPEDIKKEVYKTGEVAKLLNVTPRTIMNYDKEGKLKCSRSETNRRIVFREDLLEYLEKQKLLETERGKKDVIYVRVETKEEEEKYELERQLLRVIDKAKGIKKKPKVIKEVGSGTDEKRPELLNLLEKVMRGEVRRVYVEKREILTKYGYTYLEKLCESKGVKIEVIEE